MLLADILSSIHLASAAAAPAQSAAEGNAISIEYSISLGNLLTMASFIVVSTVYVVNSRSAAKILADRMKTFGATIDDLKDETKELKKVVVVQVELRGEINLINQRLMQEGKRVDDLASNLGAFKNTVLRDKMSH